MVTLLCAVKKRGINKFDTLIHQSTPQTTTHSSQNFNKIQHHQTSILKSTHLTQIQYTTPTYYMVLINYLSIEHHIIF